MGGIPGWDEYYLVITKLDTLGNIQWSSINGRKIRQLKIFNSLGQELRNILNINENQINPDVKDFATGLYFYELITSDNQIETGNTVGSL